MNAQNNVLVLVDGSSYVYRAFHALPALVNRSGMATGAIYGVVTMLKRLLREQDTQRFVVVFDPKGPTFRHELFSDYKANRTMMPNDLVVQIQPLYELIQAMGVPLLIEPNVEADDVIGTLTHQAEQLGWDVVISTGDKDMAQLVNDHVCLINTMSDKTYDVAGVLDKFGVLPKQMIDFLALVGDKSDNVPGVEKVGPKTAAKWLNQYGSLREICNNASKISGKVGEYLRAHIPQFDLTQQLVTIRTDVPVSVSMDDLSLREPDYGKQRTMFELFGFKSLLKDLLVQIGDKSEKKSYSLILTQAEFLVWSKHLHAASVIAIDTETTDYRPMLANLVGISFACDDDKAAYIPLKHVYENCPQQLSLDWVLRQLSAVLSDKNKIIVGQNLKFDLMVLDRHGLSVQGKLFDTMLASYVLNPTAGRHNLSALAFRYLSRNTQSYEDVVGKGVKQISFAQVVVEKACDYAAEDAEVTFALYKILSSEVESAGVGTIFEQVDMPLLKILLKMEERGVLIDQTSLLQQSSELAITIDGLAQRVFAATGEVFNLNSPKQLQTILFEKMGLPVYEKTPTGQPATSEATLQFLSQEYELPGFILNYRGLSKLKSTYTDGLSNEINLNTGRVHCSYNQAVTSTGRLSCTDPNLQNIPIKTQEGRRVRKAFIAADGFDLLSADYSQIELRIMAHISGDEGLLQAFANNQDVHKSTAAEVFSLSVSEVSFEQRRSAKAINFGLIYGMSAFGLARQLSIEQSLAQSYINRYFDRYPGVKQYMEQVKLQANEQGYVETLLGRKLYLPGIRDGNIKRRKAAQRAAINAPMQGTAADIIKLSMQKVAVVIEKYPGKIHLIMQVHDELVFEVSSDLVEIVKPQIVDAMQSAYSLKVPLLVEVGVGKNWADAH